MKKVVIISGHPDLKNSCANKTILDEISKLCPEVEIRKLDELYPDYNFDVKAEQAALEKADIILFQFPMHWSNVPGILKLYIDKVMEHGWAYGSKGTALKDKIFIASTTMGVVDSAYAAGGMMKHTVAEYNNNLEGFVLTCRLDYKKLFSMGGAMYIPGVTSEEQKNKLIDRCKKQAAEIVDCLKAL